MRITREEKQQFIDLARQNFGAAVHLYLFGSRVDDQKKGGDIDLYIETDSVVSMQQRLKFLVDIERNVTSRKVDLLVKTPESQELPIFITAKQTGILLC